MVVGKYTVNQGVLRWTIYNFKIDVVENCAIDTMSDEGSLARHDIISMNGWTTQLSTLPSDQITLHVPVQLALCCRCTAASSTHGQRTRLKHARF